MTDHSSVADAGKLPAGDIRNVVPGADVRNLPTKIVRRDAASGGSPGVLSGHAALFNVESVPMFDWWQGREFVERIAPGAFAKTLTGKPDVRALYNHDTNLVLGRTKAGTLRLSTDATGLGFEVDLPDTQWGRDTAVSVARGDIDGCSFGFVVLDDRWEELADGRLLRTLLEIELHEISPAVAFPAYEQTTVKVDARSIRARQAGSTKRPRLDTAGSRLRLMRAKSALLTLSNRKAGP